MPQCICWGPDLRQVYNERYRVILGDKHPMALGQPVLETWAEIAGDIGPLFARVLAGETVYFEDLHLTVNRGSGAEDVYFTFSYSPVLGESGEIAGALVNCVETTDQVAGRQARTERDNLMHALELERTRLAAVFSQSPSFFAILRGPDNVFEMANAAYEQLIGHGRNVVGKPLFEALPETRNQKFHEYIEQVRTTGEPLVFRELLGMLERTPGAPLEQRFFDVTYLPLIEPDGSHTAVIAHGSDVTERVVARTSLELINQQFQESAIEMEAQTGRLQAAATRLEERTLEAETARRTIAAIVEAVTDGFVALDNDLRFTYANHRAAEMWALTPEDMIGKRPHELWPPMDRTPLIAMLDRVLATGRPEVLEGYASLLRAPVEMRAYPSSAGGLVVFFADLTESRRAEAAATFLSEASRLLTSSADYQTTLTNFANAAVPRLGDWCAVDVLTEPDSQQWPPAIERVAVVHQDPDKVSLATTLTTRFPQDWTRETGTPAVIRTREPMFVPDVTDAMLVGSAQSDDHLALMRALHFRSIMIVPLVARDRVLGTITLVMAESERQFTRADLALAVDLGQRAGVALDNARLLRDTAEANAAKTAFLRTISHELRQPLNAMRGYVALWRLGLRGAIDPKMSRDIDRLSRNQEHLSALIEDLLSFTRLDAGQLTVERVPVSIADTFAALEAMIRPQISERGLAFHYQDYASGIAALGDRDRIVQVCLNLLTNAMRATPAGGHVELGCTADADVITITVRDT
ncbi:MAG: PAS domain-containing protein, partial [Gemmatimonadaceae bacterium]